MFDPILMAAKLDQTRYEFLIVDLEACSTFIRVAETALDLEDVQHANAALAKAARAYEVIGHLAAQLKDEARRNEIATNLDAVRGRMDDVRRSMSMPTAAEERS